MKLEFVVSAGNDFEAAPASFLANLDTFWVASAEVAYQYFFGLGVNVRDFSGARIDAFAAAHAFLHVDGDGAGVFVYVKGFNWAGSYARVVFALGAQMRELSAWH